MRFNTVFKTVLNKNHQKFTKCFLSSQNLVNLSIDNDGIATVTMQKPPVNSINFDLSSELSNALDELEMSKPKGMVFTSGLKSVFCAGLDINELYKPDKERFKVFWGAFQEACLKLLGAAYPTVAVVTGHAPAGGCVLAMCCDYRVMVENTTIGLNETRLAVVPPVFVMEITRNVISNRASEVALTTGDIYSTEEALKIGFVDEVASSREECVSKAVAFLKKHERIPAGARSMTKVGLRSKILNLLKDRERNLKEFYGAITHESAQQVIGEYLKELKNKSKNKVN